VGGVAGTPKIESFSAAGLPDVVHPRALPTTTTRDALAAAGDLFTSSEERLNPRRNPPRVPLDQRQGSTPGRPPHNPEAARHAAEALKKYAALLLDHPGLGRGLEGRPGRELDLPFSQRGYVMRYRLEGDDIAILKIWHSREKRQRDS
jgi:plasmid stabilization system protein ParE